MTTLPFTTRLAVLALGAYIRHFPWSRGKGFLIRRLLRPILPAPPASFSLARPGGTTVSVYYREVIGLAALIHGRFEDAECRTLCAYAKRGTTTIDVGANAGIMAIPLSQAVGKDGRVIAVEPLRENVDRLEANARRSGLRNVVVVAVAASSSEGTVRLNLANDPAYASIVPVQGYASGTSREVRASRLDTIWRESGGGDVSVVKIDVEGAEAQVLEGATELLTACRPAVMVEANDSDSLERLNAVLKPLGYTRLQQAGFMPWNHLFLPEPIASP